MIISCKGAGQFSFFTISQPILFYFYHVYVLFYEPFLKYFLGRGNKNTHTHTHTTHTETVTETFIQVQTERQARIIKVRIRDLQKFQLALVTDTMNSGPKLSKSLKHDINTCCLLMTIMPLLLIRKSR